MGAIMKGKLVNKMEIKTLSGETINNATVHEYPNAMFFAHCMVNMRHDSKIIISFCMKDREAVKDYLLRRGWQDLPLKFYVYKW